MPSDRGPRPRPNGGRGRRDGRPGGGRSGDGRARRTDGGSRSGRPGARRDGDREGRRRDGRDGPPPDRRPGGRRSGPSRRGDRDDSSGRRSPREPRTEAERRAAEVAARRGPRKPPPDAATERDRIESRTTEQWIDEGSIRDEAARATKRAQGSRAPRRAPEVDPEVVAEIHGAVDARRADRLAGRLASASQALDRERFDEARRMVAPLVRELPDVAAVHEIDGLANYRLGRWRQAARALEAARRLRPDPSILPVLADCYRALRRWDDVDRVWREVKAASPAHDVMAEARIVTASALADRGELSAAIELMRSVEQPPKRVREHHLRQWYVLGDLLDRAGDTIAARRWFGEIAAHDADFADVRDRLRALGR